MLILIHINVIFKKLCIRKYYTFLNFNMARSSYFILIILLLFAAPTKQRSVQGAYTGTQEEQRQAFRGARHVNSPPHPAACPL